MRVIDVLRPLDPPAAVGLSSIDQLVVGRGDVRDLAIAVDGGLRRADWREADPWMSGVHFRVERSSNGWMLSDAGSKNGTRLNGAQVARQQLSDGDVIDVGRTVFIFRAHGPTDSWLDLADGPSDPEMRTLSYPLAVELATLATLAESRVPVLIYGETGTGKEVAARFVHRRSARPGRFVGVNCGAIPAGIAEAELFGAVKGAYSGATDGREGHIRAADGGTLFLDEIAELPPPVQTSLLRALQEREVTPVGSSKPTPVDLRLVAATHGDLQARCDAGEFRDDLHARLRGHVVTLPPLRDRIEDLGILIASLLERLAGDAAGEVRFRVSAIRTLLGCRWRYNIRELAQALESALALAGDGPIAESHLPAFVRDAPGGDEDGVSAARLRALLEQNQGNVTAVARILSTSRSQIRRLAKRHGIDLEALRSADE